jgi:hypothetical protein
MFTTVPLRRGFTEIKEFYELCEKHDAIICGGYARYCASPHPTHKVIMPLDVDMFPRTKETAKSLLKDLREMGYKKQHENDVSISLQPKKSYREKLYHLPSPQIIKPVSEGRVLTMGTAEDILGNFDFTVVRAAIIGPEVVLVDKDFESDERNKVLRLKNIHCPISSTLRCTKYAKKGYFLKPSEALKLFVDWDNRGDEYKERMIELFSQSSKGKKSKDNPNGITQKDIDELEALLFVD